MQNKDPNCVRPDLATHFPHKHPFNYVFWDENYSLAGAKTFCFQLVLEPYYGKPNLPTHNCRKFVAWSKDAKSNISDLFRRVW